MLKGVWTLYEAPLKPDEFTGSIAIGADDSVWVEIIQQKITQHDGWSESASWPARLLVLDHGRWMREYDFSTWGCPVHSYYLAGMITDSQGALWFCADSGALCRFDGEAQNMFIPRQGDTPLLGAQEPQLAADPVGGIWIALEEHGACHFYEGIWQAFNGENSLLHGKVTAVTVDYSRVVWFASFDNEVMRFITYDGQSWKQQCSFERMGRNKEEIKALAVDRCGIVWAGWRDWEKESRRGLWRIDPDRGHYTQFTKKNSQLPCTNIDTLALDSRDRLWVGTIGGVTVFDPDQSATWTVVNLGEPESPSSRAAAHRRTLKGDQLAMTYVFSPRIDSQDRVWSRAKKGVVVFSEA